MDASTTTGTSHTPSVASVRISDIVQCFNGEGDVVQWLEKLELVAELHEITNVQKLLPLFLEGQAFAVFKELGAAEKGNLSAIKAALTDAFALNPFQAYEQLTRRKWCDEPVDFFLSDLRRLAKVAGIENEELIRRAFVVGLPPGVSRELRALAKIDSLSLSDVLTRARALLAEQVEGDCNYVATARKDEKMKRESKRCFRCDGPHLIKDCKAFRSRRVVCWTCGEEGHVARQCSQREQGNGNGRAGAPVALPKEH